MVLSDRLRSRNDARPIVVGRLELAVLQRGALVWKKQPTAEGGVAVGCFFFAAGRIQLPAPLATTSFGQRFLVES